MAVREGFEPSVPFDRYGALAKRCFRPLSHLTKIGCENMANNRRLPTACVKYDTRAISILFSANRTRENGHRAMNSRQQIPSERGARRQCSLDHVLSDPPILARASRGRN